MKPAPFSIMIPETVEEAVACIAEQGEDARVIAGGQSLMAMLNMRLTEPKMLVDVSRLAELHKLEIGPEGLTVGASVTQAEVFHHADLARHMPIIREALAHVGHIQTRNRGTVCGSLCHADPSAEMPLLLATLGGTVTLQSASGSRTLSASEFQTGLLETARRQDELCVSAHFPSLPASAKWGFREISRRDGDFAIVAMACVADKGVVRLGVGGVSDAPTVEEWDRLAPADIPDALNRLAWKMGGNDDIHASARYRRELVRRIGKTLIEEVLA
ncbi:MAG: FAD binding domain-containing protein [Roseovarius sp.]